jgi:surfactin synthase thioesterase subunit
MTYQPDLRCIHLCTEQDAPTTDVYWITHAGGGVNSLAHRMRVLGESPSMPRRLGNVWTLAMPAREDLAAETFDGELDDLAVAVADTIAQQRKDERAGGPFAVVGHSFGSVLAYRIVCGLMAQDVAPNRLVVLSFPAPDRLSHEQELHRLSDMELVEQVDVLFGGVPENIKSDVDAQSFFVPGLRLDLGLLERFRFDGQTPELPLPVTAVCGIDDRAVNMAQMQRWQMVTSAAFRLVAMPGDHFFPLVRAGEILKLALT